VIPLGISELSATIDKQIEIVICRLLEREITKRFRTAREVLDQLIGKRAIANLCPHCNGENPQNVKYCNHCGQPLAGYKIPETEAERQLNLSYSLLRAGQIDEAIELAQNIVKAHPDSGKGWGQLAFMLNTDRRYEDALKAAEQCISRSPGFAIGYRNKAIALSALGRFSEAIAQFDLALAREERPRDRSQILYNKAYALRLSGKFAEAIEILKEALKNDPLNSKASRLLSRLQQEKRESGQRASSD
jgi:tetratricopeptide (TPR) repeat protein